MTTTDVDTQTATAALTAQVSRASHTLLRRTEAQQLGTPIQRSTNPTVIAPAFAHTTQLTAVIKGARPLIAHPDELKRLVIISIDNGDLIANDTATGVVDKVTFALMDSLSATTLVTNGKAKPRDIPARAAIIMFADHQALRAMMRLARKNPNNSESRLDRVMDVSTSLPMSQLFPVLTRALALRFYLQADLETNLIGDWVSGFHLNALSTQDALVTLAFQTIRSTTTTADRSPDPALLELARSETFLAKSAAYRSTTADVSAFRSITSITDDWTFYRDLDVKLIPENIAGSSVFAGALLSSGGHGAHLVRMYSAPKLKAGDDVIAIVGEGESVTKVTIDTIRIEADSIIVKLKRDIGRGSGRVAFVKKPFAGGARTPFASPWSSGKFTPTEGMIERNLKAEIPQRSMPLDVLIAGQH